MRIAAGTSNSVAPLQSFVFIEPLVHLLSITKILQKLSLASQRRGSMPPWLNTAAETRGATWNRNIVAPHPFFHFNKNQKSFQYNFA
jgi:hypothetical protein